MRAVGLALVALAACSTPQYHDGGLRCAPSGRACPDGFACAADGHCWRLGDGPDLAGAAAPSKCASAGALLCDGFEAPTIDGQWDVGGTAAIDTTRAYRGNASLHVHTEAAAAGTDPIAGLFESRTFPASSPVYVRVWAFFPTGYPTAFNQVINFVDTGTTGISYSLEGGFPVDNNYAGNAFRQSSTVPVPIGQWTCLRMSLSQPAGTGDVHLYVDGTEAADTALAGTTLTTMRGVHFGVDWFGNPDLPPTDTWLDEILVDDKPVTCDE